MASSLSPGSTLGPYEILGPLGVGGMGEVYRARDTRLDREVAIKVLPAGHIADPERRRRFFREARSASALNHPNIVTVHDIASDGGVDFLVMEYVRGQTLSRMIPPHGLPLSLALDYASQVADAVAKAHAAGILHRDLKPGNIMINEDGRAKVLDFGLAKPVGLAAEQQPAAGQADAETFTLQGAILGTVGYMSPEQALGQPVDGRSDVFSLGVVLYEMLCGVRPFQGPSVLAVLNAVCTVQPVPPRLKRQDIPEEVERAILRAIEKDTHRRYRSMAAFASELRRLAGKSSQTAELELTKTLVSAAPRKRPAWPRLRWKWLGAGFLAVALAVGGAWVIPRIRSGSPARASNPYGAYREARAALARDDQEANVERAIAGFQGALAANPAHALSHAGLAEAYVAKHRLTREERLLELATASAGEALKLDPHLAVAHSSQGVVLAATGRNQEAERAFRHALDLDPKNAETHRRLSSVLGIAGKLDEAEDHATKAVGIAPGDWKTHLQLSIVMFRRGRYEESLAACQKARDLAPDSDLPYRNLAAAYHMLDRWEEAAEALQRALEIRPAPASYSNLGTVLYYQGRFPESAGAFEKATGLAPDNSMYWGNLGDALRWTPNRRAEAAKAYATAIGLARKALAAAPQNTEVRSRLALYLAKSDKKSEAMRELAQLRPDFAAEPYVLFKIAMTQELCGERDKALETLGAAIRAGLTMPEVIRDPELAALRDDARFQKLLAGKPKR